jgi:hypothetical protein
MGVNTPYLPPELLPEKEVELKDAARAMEQLQSASIQCPTPSLPESSVKTVDETNSDEAVEDEAAELPEAPSLEEVEEKRALLKSGKIGLMMVICWSKAFPESVELVKDEQGTVIDLKLVESAAPQHERQPTTDDQVLEVGEEVKFKNCSPEYSDSGPFVIRSIHGDKAKLDRVEKLVLLSELELVKRRDFLPQRD